MHINIVYASLSLSIYIYIYIYTHTCIHIHTTYYTYTHNLYHIMHYNCPISRLQTAIRATALPRACGSRR